MPDSVCNASLRVMAAPTSPISHVPQILPTQGPTGSRTEREAKERKKERSLKRKREGEKKRTERDSDI